MRRDAQRKKQAAQALIQAGLMRRRIRQNGRHCLLSPRQPPDVAQQDIGLEGLDQVKLRPQLHRPHHKVVACQRRGHDHLRCRGRHQFPHLLHQRVAVHHGHYDVGYHHVITALA